jgi:hypothetical protein
VDRIAEGVAALAGVEIEGCWLGDTHHHDLVTRHAKNPCDQSWQ